MRAAVSRAPFALSAALVVAACALVVRSSAFARNPELAAWGVTFDLTLTIPLLYWFFVVRPGRAPLLTIAPLFVACTIVATALIPRGHQQFVRDLGRFAVPLVELVLIGAIVSRLRRARREDAIRALLGDNRIAAVVESELSMLYYATIGWRLRPAMTEGRALTFHQRSGWGTVLACVFVLLAAEGLGMHLLLGQWSASAAWAWTALDVWGAMWLAGDYNALRVRRTELTADALHVRFGLRWTVSVPLEAVASIEAIRAETEWKRRDVLKLAMLDEPRWLVTLREPLLAKGLAGLRKEVRALALLPDDEDAISALQSAVCRAGRSSERP